MRMPHIAGAFAMLACLVASSYAQTPSTGSAQAYPAKTVRYVVAFPAGDSPDIVARLVADRISRLWDQQVVITGTNVVHIAYKGASPALADLMGGQIPVMLANLPAMLPHIISRKIRALAVTSAKRTAQLPSVATMIESGVRDYVVTPWYGMCVPAGTPQPILEKLHTDLLRTLQLPDVQQRLTDLVIDVAPNSRQEFTAFIRSELERWARVVKDAGIPPQ